MDLKIFCDDNHEGKWFSGLSTYLTNVPLLQFKKRGLNPIYIEKLLRYDRPDIILVGDDVPRLVLEKTREVPTGHNVGQRFGRLVNAAEEGVMIIFFLPYAARKHGKYSSICYIPARLFNALQKMEIIHHTPILAVNWPSDSSYELVKDTSENALLAELIEEIIENKFVYSKCKAINNIRRLMIERSSMCHKSTVDPPNSVRIEDTKTYFRELEIEFPNDYESVPYITKSRPLSVIYEIGMTEEKCKRTDPYTGTQFIYDYLLCRHGPATSDKHSNLILSLLKIPKNKWLKANPNIPSGKSALWYATADLIIMKDGIIPCTSTIGHQ